MNSERESRRGTIALIISGVLFLCAATAGITARQVVTAAPSTITGAASSNSEGTSQALARADHTHACIYTATGAGAVTQTCAQRWGQIVSVKDYGARGDSDCTTGSGTNNLAAFQAAYAALPATGGTITIPNDGGCYRIDGTGGTVASPVIAMNITTPNVHIVGMGAPEIFMDGWTLASSAAAGFDVVGAEVFTIFAFTGTTHGSVEGVRFLGLGDGTTALPANQSRAKGVGFTNSTHMRASHVMGYLIVGNVVNARGTGTTSDVVVSDSYADGCNENGFNYMGGTFDSVFANNVSINNLYQGFESGTYRLTVTGNVLNGNKNGWSHVGRYASFSGNTVLNNTVSGVDLQFNNSTFDCAYNSISGNTISNNLSVGVLVNSSCHHNTITGNRIANSGPVGATTGEGIKISSSATDFHISGNWIGDDQGASATQKWGVDVIAGSRVSVVGNTFKGNTALSGLTQSTADSVIFSNNVADQSFSIGGTSTNSSIRGNDGKLGPVLDTYGTTVTPCAGCGERHQLSVTDGVAFTIAAPTQAASGMLMCTRLKNVSGGVMGAITMNAVFKMPAIVAPASATSRTYCWLFDGTNWVEQFRSAADVPN